MFEDMSRFFEKYIPIKIGITDVIEIIILAVVFYEVMIWAKKSKGWILFKGIVTIMLFMVVASLFQLNTILWIMNRTLSVGVIAIVILFQPELREALEKLGEKNIINKFFLIDPAKKADEGSLSDNTVKALVNASYELGRTKTGALIVIEREIDITKQIETGIELKAKVSSQLLINIFEHNTPLHDGAVIIRKNIIESATSYLPLSENNEISKELGTRHRAALGISEKTDSFTIIVSEETGQVSVAQAGLLYRNISSDKLKKMLVDLQDKNVESKRHFMSWRGKQDGGE